MKKMMISKSVRVGGVSLNKCEVQSVDVSVAQLRVGVAQLRSDVCTADDMLYSGAWPV